MKKIQIAYGHNPNPFSIENVEDYEFTKGMVHLELKDGSHVYVPIDKIMHMKVTDAK